MRRRANPSLEPAPFQIQRCHAEGGPWFTVDRLWSEEGADDWALGPLVELDVGDLVRLVAPEGEGLRYWLSTPSGLRDAGPLPMGLRQRGFGPMDWGAAWEGPLADGSSMLAEARGVDRRALVDAARACAREALWGANDDRPRVLLDAVGAWVLEGSERASLEVRAAMDAYTLPAALAPWASVDALVSDAVANAAYYVGRIVRRPPSDDNGAAADAATSASSVGAAAYFLERYVRERPATADDARIVALQQLAPLVRARISLAAVLAARAALALR